MKQWRVILQLLLIVPFLVTLAGCDAFRPQAGPMWQQDLFQDAPPGPENFRLGWKDGCHTGVSSSGNQHQKLFYGFKQDWRLAQDEEYYTGWKLGWTYCQRYMYQYFRRELF